jgi:hypothetical protein
MFVARCCGPGALRLSLLTVCPTPQQAFHDAQLQLHGSLSPAWQTEAAQPAEAAQPLQRSVLVASVTKAIDQRLTEDMLAAAVLKRLATDEAKLVSAQCLATLLMNKLDQALFRVCSVPERKTLVSALGFSELEPVEDRCE